MKKIPLTQGKYALIDDTDFEVLNRFKWCASKYRNTFYAVRNLQNKDNKRTTVKMHSIIMKTPKGMQIDHIDGDGLNNQRNNIRIATHTENQYHKGKYKNNTSGFKGVSWNSRVKKWHAQISYDGRNRNLGDFSSKELAYEAYTKMCLKYHGDFAKL